MRLKLLMGISAGVVSLAACSVAPVETAVRQAPAAIASLPADIPVSNLVGSWGVASFHNVKDQKRSESMARVHCRNPYDITKGPTDGVMMHAADDPKRYELTFKRAPNGKTYLGFNAPPGHDQDREVVTYSKDKFVLRFVNKDINKRYGTYVYIRCGGSPRS